MALTQVNSDGIGDGQVKGSDLENSGVSAGTYGSSSAIPAITVDAKGRITSASTNNVNIDSTAISNGTSNLSVSLDGNITAVRSGTTRMVISPNGVRVTGRVELNGSNGRIEYNNTAHTFEFFTNNTKVAEFLSGGSFVPGSNNTYDLGSGSYKWRHGYFDGNHYAGYYETDNSFRAKSDNGGIYFGDTSGGFGNSCAIARALQNGFHASGSQAGDFVIGAEYQKSILFGTTTNTSGGITGRCRLTNSGNFVPTSNNSYDLGTSSLRWRNVYTNDLNLSNEGSTNDVDGTWGSWTIQEGEDDLFLLNRRNGKKYKFNLTEVS